MVAAIAKAKMSRFAGTFIRAEGTVEFTFIHTRCFFPQPRQVIYTGFTASFLAANKIRLPQPHTMHDISIGCLVFLISSLRLFYTLRVLLLDTLFFSSIR